VLRRRPNLPTWWIVAFSAAVFIAGFGYYLALYPGFGAFKGLLGWTSLRDELARAQAQNGELEASCTIACAARPSRCWRADPEALRVGEALFVDNCAACHGRSAREQPAVRARI
jgi:cytochrome c oxidase cbb3-type subunit 3